MAVEDLASKPMISVSIGTKIPPPPTPPMLPRAAPKNPIMEPNTSLQPNSISCPVKPKKTQSKQEKKAKYDEIQIQLANNISSVGSS